MGYEINVSKNGQHYFSTSDRSIGHDVLKCDVLYDQLKKAFPENEGYKLSVTNWTKVGHPYDIENERLVREEKMKNRTPSEIRVDNILVEWRGDPNTSRWM